MDPPHPSKTRLRRSGGIAVIIVLALILIIFIGENLAQMKDMAEERATPAPAGGEQRSRPAS